MSLLSFYHFSKKDKKNMEHDVDALLQRYEMGQAYKRITAEMGPSPQLVAFVNYDKITDDSIGLESFDISAKHELILAEIEDDNSLDLACEGLISRIKSAGSRIKIAATLNKHARDLDKFVGSKLESRDNNTNPISYTDFEKFVTICKKSLSVTNALVSKAPKTHDLDAWSKVNADTFVSDNFLNESDAFIQNVKHVDFKVSGWTAENFKNGIKVYQSDTEAYEKTMDKVLAYLDDLETFIHHAKRKKDKNALKSIKAVQEGINLSACVLEESSGSMWQAMNDVAQHFKVAE